MNKLSLILPTYGGNIENAKRTIESVRPFVDDVVVVSTCIHLDDKQAISDIADTVVELPWNSVFTHGFSYLHNAGIPACQRPWIILLGVSETIAEQYQPIMEVTSVAQGNHIFLLDHHNDINRWGRIFCRDGPCRWSGIIHEAVRGGPEMGVVARMQDTPKTPCDNPLKNEVLKWIKACSYHVQYWRLLNDSALLQGTDPGWLNFVNGSKEHIIEFRESHQDLIAPCLSGDLVAFLKAVDARMDRGDTPNQVNFAPTGEPMTEGAMPA